MVLYCLAVNCYQLWFDEKNYKNPKSYNKSSKYNGFWKREACGQTVLPDRSVLIDQKLVESVKIEKFKCDILADFQTLWASRLSKPNFWTFVGFFMRHFLTPLKVAILQSRHFLYLLTLWNTQLSRTLYLSRSLLKSVIIGIITHKNPILAVLQSKIGRKLGILAWAGTGQKVP